MDGLGNLAPTKRHPSPNEASMRKTPRYTGNAPSALDGWEKIKTVKCCEGEWSIFIRPQFGDKDAVAIKVASIVPVKRKANYWIFRNTVTGEFGQCRDIGPMIEYRPELVDEVVKATNYLCSS